MSAIELEKLDYSNMMCNVMALPAGKDPLEEFDFLRKHDEFHVPLVQLNKKKVLRYICLVYDKGSPLHDIYTDLWRKKMAAAELALFMKEDNGRFNGKVEEMMRCENKYVNAMILRYVTGFHAAKYNRYVLFKEMEFRESENLLNGKTKIDEFNKISRELETCEEELLAGDNRLKEDLSRYYFEDKLELRPEDIAARLTKGEEPIKLEPVDPEY